MKIGRKNDAKISEAQFEKYETLFKKKLIKLNLILNVFVINQTE